MRKLEYEDSGRKEAKMMTELFEQQATKACHGLSVESLKTLGVKRRVLTMVAAKNLCEGETL